MKKLKLIGVFTFFGLCITFLLTSWDPIPEEIPEVFEQHPPIPTEYWVQKLGNAHPEGKLVLGVEFQSDIKLPENLKIYLGKDIATTLRDDGVFPDNVAEDMEYVSILDQDPDQFVEQYQRKETTVLERGYLLHFQGHIGELIQANAIQKFNVDEFNNFLPTQLDPMIADEPFCEQGDIEKHKSLLITDLRVVEDPARTYNIVDQTGNPTGAWTFGELMKNMAGGITDVASEQKVRDFLKGWVLGIGAEYEYLERIGIERDQVSLFDFIIKPWLLKALGETYYDGNTTVTNSNWEDLWATVHINDLLANAPFKLTAIVNRLDLRGNSAYTNALSNSGETSFIFSLISAYNYNINNNRFDWQIGMPPIHRNTNFAQEFSIDWQGMNVILEYGNVESDKCDVKQRAQDWVALSSYDFDNALELQEYLSDLQILTDHVTAAGAAPNRVNGSAINQVRTNEKLLAFAPEINDDSWEPANWQLRQFELDQETGLLVNAPVTNVPLESQNVARNSHTFFEIIPDSHSVPDWIYGVNQASNKNRVKNGNHKLPAELLEPVAELKDELMHYYEFDYWDENEPQEFTDLFSESNLDLVSSDREKEIQRQLSLNTCQGCHAGETKTAFTMIRPLGYGQEANYWEAIPSTRTGHFDARFYDNLGEQMNTGKTWDEYAQQPQDNYKPHYYAGDSVSLPDVSPFLTGRNYRGLDENGEPNWQDDFYSNQFHPDNSLNNPENLFADDRLTGMFYVNNPANRSGATAGSGPFPKHHENRNGFNELERRKKTSAFWQIPAAWAL